MKLAVWLALALVTVASPSTADDDVARETHEEVEPAALFQRANEALAGGRPSEAIAKLEALADRGVVDPVISFDRGLAYAARVRAGGEQPGDLGRAAHGFEETVELTSDPQLASDAASAVATIRSEVARRRARAGESVEIEHGFSLGRSIVALLPENVWAVVAAFAALVLTIAILVRQRVELPRAKVAATTSGSVAAIVLVLSSILAWAARDARLHLREAVLIVPNARLLDLRHLALDGVAPLPEGVRARIVVEHGGYTRVVIGALEGYLPSSSVLPLAKR